MAVLRALEKIRHQKWFEECQTWLYRGAWQEWEPYRIQMAIPMSPSELLQKRFAIYKHQSQKVQLSIHCTFIPRHCSGLRILHRSQEEIQESFGSVLRRGTGTTHRGLFYYRTRQVTTEGKPQQSTTNLDLLITKQWRPLLLMTWITRTMRSCNRKE